MEQREQSIWQKPQVYIRGIYKMLNAVGRDISEEILKLTGKEVFQGNHHFDGYEYRKQGPKTKCVINSNGSKTKKCNPGICRETSLFYHFTLGAEKVYGRKSIKR